MFRAGARLAPQASRSVAARQTRALSLKVAPIQPVRASARIQVRSFADASRPPPSSGAGDKRYRNELVIFAVTFIAVGSAAYYYYSNIKPVVDTVNTARQMAPEGTEDALKSVFSGDYSALEGIAKAALPSSAMAIYSKLQSEGGVNGFLTSLKDKDFQGAIDEIKKVGGDDVKRIVEKVEGKVKEAKGNPKNVDWRGLAEELKKELPKDKQGQVDMLIGYLPSQQDIEGLIKKAKGMGEDKIKEIETAASKVLASVDKAKKEGKGQADAFLKGLKDAAPEDIDGLIKQLKEAAKSAGLPADTAEAWLKSKAKDGKVDAESIAQNVQGKIQTAAHFIPGQPKDFIDQVSQFSPSVAQLLARAMQQAGVVDEKLNKK